LHFPMLQFEALEIQIGMQLAYLLGDVLDLVVDFVAGIAGENQNDGDLDSLLVLGRPVQARQSEHGHQAQQAAHPGRHGNLLCYRSRARERALRRAAQRGTQSSFISLPVRAQTTGAVWPSLRTWMAASAAGCIMVISPGPSSSSRARMDKSRTASV